MAHSRLGRVELARLHTLRGLRIVNGPPLPSLDRAVVLSAQLLGAPIAIVTLIERHLQIHRAIYGLRLDALPREHSFCDHTIRQDGVMIVPDATADDRFRRNPLVCEAPHIRFYAGMPLVARDGSKIGALCVLDTVPRRFDPSQARLLEHAGGIVMDILHLFARSRSDRGVPV
jgi:GAF domain-containing protein